MRIYICDDELQIVKQLTQQVQKCIPQSEMTQFILPSALLQAIKERPCDILLLDIDMPELTGLEIAALLNHMKHKPLLIFITSHDELVYDSLQFHPFGFVRKSFLETELPKVLADCEKELQLNKASYHFRTAEGDVCLSLQDILCFEASGNYLNVLTNDKNYRFRETLSNVQTILETQGFVRIHKGFLVNIAAIELLGSNQITLKNGNCIPIGRNYGESAKKQIMRYMLR